MKTLKMTPRQFCRFALQFQHLSFAEIAGMVKEECLPSSADIAETAEVIADRLTPTDGNLAKHVFLHELAAAAAEAGKAVAA